MERTDREFDKAVQAILDGVPGARLKDKIGTLEARKAELTELLARAEELPPHLHPNMAEIYRQRISALHDNLQSDDGKVEAAEILRTLVGQVTLVPESGNLAIVLRGDPGRPRTLSGPLIRLAIFWIRDGSVGPGTKTQSAPASK